MEGSSNITVLRSIILLSIYSLAINSLSIFSNELLESGFSLNISGKVLRFLDSHVEPTVIVSPISLVHSMCWTNSIDNKYALIKSDGLAWSVTQQIINKVEIFSQYSTFSQDNQDSKTLEEIVDQYDTKKNMADVLLTRSIQNSLLEIEEIRGSILKKQFLNLEIEGEDNTPNEDEITHCGIKVALLEAKTNRLIFRQFGLNDSKIFDVFILKTEVVIGDQYFLSLRNPQSSHNYFELADNDDIIILYEGQKDKNIPLNILDYLFNCFCLIIRSNLRNNQAQISLVNIGQITRMINKFLIPILEYVRNKLGNATLLPTEDIYPDPDFQIDYPSLAKVNYLDFVMLDSENYALFRQSNFCYSDGEQKLVREAINPDDLNRFYEIIIPLLIKKKLIRATTKILHNRISSQTSITALKIGQVESDPFMANLKEINQKLIHNKITTYDYWMNASDNKKIHSILKLKLGVNKSSVLDIDEDLQRNSSQETNNFLDERVGNIIDKSKKLYQRLYQRQPSADLKVYMTKKLLVEKSNGSIIQEIFPGANNLTNIDSMDLKTLFQEIPVNLIISNAKVERSQRNKIVINDIELRNKLKENGVEVSILEESENLSHPISIKIEEVESDKQNFGISKNRILAADVKEDSIFSESLGQDSNLDNSDFDESSFIGSGNQSDNASEAITVTSKYKPNYSIQVLSEKSFEIYNII